MSYTILKCPFCKETSMYENPTKHEKIECLDCGINFEVRDW